MSEPFPGAAADLTDEFVLRKCEYFTTVHLWPLRAEMNPRLWLQNFEDHELRHARYLLNSFIFLSDLVTERLAVSAFQSLSRLVVPPFQPAADALQRWQEFLGNVVVVPVPGEIPRPTDSGYSFARLARDSLGIPQDRIRESSEALSLLAREEASIVFLDDFVGSGEQFITMWERREPIPGVGERSFELLSRAGRGSFYYCPVVATDYGCGRIERRCHRVLLSPAHRLPDRYNVFHDETLTWPADLQPTAEDFVLVASQRAGIPDTNGSEDDWRGFHKLGLTIGFGHGVPDATLPLFWWESETWNPLKRRSRN